LIHFEKVDDTGADKQVAEVAALLRRARIASHKSMHQLARETGMNQVAVSRIEKGERSPTLRSVIKIAAALGLEFRLFAVSEKEGPPLE
jgi:transcriptional regulator with XRE-family HTH domain